MNKYVEKVMEKAIEIHGERVFQVDGIVGSVILVSGTVKGPVWMEGSRDEEVKLERKQGPCHTAW